MCAQRRSYIPTVEVVLPTPTEIGNAPTSSTSFGTTFNDSNFIGAGLNNSIVDSQKCSIINGTESFISGKYNCHVIGDYIGIEGVTDVEDNSFNVGCYRGMNLWGQMNVKRGGAVISGHVGINGSLVTSGTVQINEYIDGDLNVTGNVYASEDVVAFSSSDERLKEDKTPISGALEKISTLDPIEFNWNDKQSIYSGHDIGLIAQQVQSIAPEIVTQRADGYLAMKYEKMVPLLVGAIQDQQKIINEMRAELDEIKSKINC